MEYDIPEDVMKYFNEKNPKIVERFKDKLEAIKKVKLSVVLVKHNASTKAGKTFYLFRA